MAASKLTTRTPSAFNNVTIEVVKGRVTNHTRECASSPKESVPCGVTVSRGKVRRKRYTAQEKHELVAQSYLSGMSVSEFSRTHNLSPDLLFRWRSEEKQKELQSQTPAEGLYTYQDLLAAREENRRLQRLIGKLATKIDILEDAIEIATEKKWLAG